MPDDFDPRRYATPASQSPRYVTARKARGLYAALVVVLAGIVLVCAGLLGRYLLDAYNARLAGDELRALYHESETDAPEAPALPSVTETPPPAATSAPEAAPVVAQAAAQAATQGSESRLYPNNPSFRVSEKMTKLRGENFDIVGWLSIDSLLDEAVVQRDNSYYLTHDYQGKRNYNGAIFLDEGCDLRTVPDQLLVHGHNMKTGAMFGCLARYKSKGAAFLREHGFITLDTLYESAEYAVFAVAEVSTAPSKSHYFSFVGHAQFFNQDEMDRYVARAKALSLYQIDIDVQPGDRLLTLATCIGDNSDERLLVMARMLRPGEDRMALQLALYSAR